GDVNMKVEEIIQILIKEKNYDKVKTERLAPKIEALPVDIKDALVLWIKSGDVASPVYNVYTVEKILKAKPGMTTLAAYLTLDWIRKDPKTAIKAVMTPVMKFSPHVER